MKESAKQIGLRIRKKRELLGLTRDQWCHFVDRSPEFLSELEREKKGPSAETLMKLCKGLSVSADYLLLGRETISDGSEITKALENSGPAYVHLAEEHLKVFLKTVGLLESHNV